MKQKTYLLFLLIFLLFAPFSVFAKGGKTNNCSSKVWPIEKSKKWAKEHGWISGCNFIPSTAINQIEMWQADSFDKATIDKELGWAQELGFNAMRVYLSSRVWENDPKGMIQRMDEYLTISDKHGISTIFCFFDDCWSAESALGKQPDPKPGVHNSGWVRDPSVSLRNDTATLFQKLEKYQKAVMTAFKDDKRIILWDLYNEPGNNGHGCTSLPLLKNTFKWARSVNPSQPITAGIWSFGCLEMNQFQAANSDVITYHNYGDVNDHQYWINLLQILDRPMVCTEYMARRNNSLFSNILPLLKEKQVGAINWGFVAGKTNTIHAWDEPMPDGKEPKLWFHDIYRTDKTPFDVKEIEIIKRTNQK